MGYSLAVASYQAISHKQVLFFAKGRTIFINHPIYSLMANIHKSWEVLQSEAAGIGGKWQFNVFLFFCYLQGRVSHPYV
jgi:hypothetical protein